MRVSEFASDFKEKAKAKGLKGYDHLSDSDLIQLVAQKKPELMKKVDRQDLAMVMKESQAKSLSRERQKQFSSLSGYSRFMSGTGAGMLDVYQGIKQMLGGDTSEYKDDKKAYMEASKGDLAAGLGEVTGAIAATAPIPGFTGAKLASKVASPILKTGIGLGTAATIGAGMGATEFVDENETRGQNTAYGALFGVGGALAGTGLKKMGAKAYNWYKGKMKDAPTQEIFDLAKQYGINLRASDITGEGKFGDKALERIPLGGMSGQAKKTSKQVQGAILGEKEKLTSGWDDEIQESLNRQARKGKAEARINYDKVDELSGNATIKPINALEKAKQYELDLADNVMGGGENVFTKLKDNLANAKTFKQLRKAREDIGNAAQKATEGNDRNLARQLNDVKKGIEFDIDDLVKGGRDEGGSVVVDMDPDKYGALLEEYRSAGAIDDLAETMKGFGENKGVIQRMANYVKLNGNKKNKGSNLLVREHIPKNQFGSSSDEMAANLGMDESDFMQMLDDIPTRGKVKKTTEELGFPADWGDVKEKAIQPKKEVLEAYKKARTEYRKNVVPYNQKSIVNDLQTNTPDEIYRKYMQPGKGDKAENFYKLLDDKGKKALKNGFLENAFKNATDDINDPDAFYSPKKLANYFSKMADSKNRIFTPEELKHYNGFAKLMKHSERYGQINESPSTGMLSIPVILGSTITGGALTNPLATAVGTGGGLLLSNLATFMKTYGKRLTLASGEIGSEAYEKKIKKILGELPKLTAVTSIQLEGE